MRPAAAIAAGVAVLLAAGGCRSGSAGKGDAAPAPVAVVNGEPIPRAALERELQQLRVGGEGTGPAEVLRQSALDGLVSRTLLLQQARTRGIAVGPEQVDRAFLALRSEYPGTAFDDMLAQERLTVADLRTRIAEQLTVERLFQEEVFPRIQVSDDEVAAWYAAHAAEFDEPERVHARQIVVQTREEATRLRDEVRRKPASFSAVASRASIAPEAKRGGDLGWFGKGQGMPEVFDACFKLAPGTVSDVVPSPFGFHVFQVVEKKPPGRRTLDQARPAIAARLLREKRARAQEEYVAALRSQAKIQIDPTAVASVKP
ncbi:MAG TPA: peptidyl-prolyl cis-trans isomerase [Anaeromyxobacteraceae bacterium]|nr:peptidyl-prolyl cis-trans isomerase [Anaeromyxobacteraceae bacterium]